MDLICRICPCAQFISSHDSKHVFLCNISSTYIDLPPRKQLFCTNNIITLNNITPTVNCVDIQQEILWNCGSVCQMSNIYGRVCSQRSQLSSISSTKNSWPLCKNSSWSRYNNRPMTRAPVRCVTESHKCHSCLEV